MKSSRTPAILLVLLYLCFLGVWAWSGSQLPDRVATHFNGSGEPNGWMSRSANQGFMLIFGLMFPLFVAVLCYTTRFLPASFVNIPNKDYWLAPERKKETSRYLVHHSLWFSCLALLFVIGIQFSIVQANKQATPQLSMATFLAVVGSFLVGTAVWSVALYRHFRRPVQ